MGNTLNKTRQQTGSGLISVQDWYKLYSTEDISEFIEEEDRKWKVQI
jgi:hypothetical protein